MAIITEDYVSFETAKLLKEKRFTEPCQYYYFSTGDIHRVYGLKDRNCASVNTYSAPTLQMAMKWLRKVYNIHVVPKFDFYAGDYTGRIYDGRRETAEEKDDYIAIIGNKTYEEAAEIAIRYCLENLI